MPWKLNSHLLERRRASLQRERQLWNKPGHVFNPHSSRRTTNAASVHRLKQKSAPRSADRGALDEAFIPPGEPGGW